MFSPLKKIMYQKFKWTKYFEFLIFVSITISSRIFFCNVMPYICSKLLFILNIFIKVILSNHLFLKFQIFVNVHNSALSERTLDILTEIEPRCSLSCSDNPLGHRPDKPGEKWRFHYRCGLAFVRRALISERTYVRTPYPSYTRKILYVHKNL